MTYNLNFPETEHHQAYTSHPLVKMGNNLK